MSKYIDADLLHKEIEGRLNEAVELKGIAKRICPAAHPIYEAAEGAYRGLLLFVDHQRQEKKVVDLMEEIDSFYRHEPCVGDLGYYDFRAIAEHFYELGKQEGQR